MLSEMEMLRYQSVTFNLSDTAKAYIRDTRTSEPTRMAGKHARYNLTSWRESIKTGATISLESRGPETAFFMLSEYDPRVLEIWDQPEPVCIERHNKNRKKISMTYTPDFLILTEDGPVVVEVKHCHDIARLTEKYPLDWVRCSNGSVKYLPAEHAFAEMGVRFEVFVYDTNMRYLIANTELMLMARRKAPVCAALRGEVNKALTERFFWNLDDLRARLGLKEFTSLVQLIDEGAIQADLRADLLSEPEGFLVASTLLLLETGRSLLKQHSVARDEHKGSLGIDRVPTTRDAEHVLQKLSAIKSGGSPRSVTRWKAQIVKGEAEGLSPFQSLLPKYYLCGNRSRRIQKVVDEFLIDYLMEEHARSPGLSKYRSYIRYRVLAADAHVGVKPVSRKTFDARLAQLPAELVARGRGGARAANALAAPSDPELRNLPAQLPWEQAAIDHYLADIFLVYHSSDGKVYVERPWITAMIDLRTSYVLAVTMSFLAPSKRAVSKVIRECVRLHGRLPNEIIVDRGSEFQSTFMASLMSHYSVAYTLRPSSHPRFGSQVERLFGEFKSMWLSQRPGNLASFSEARSVDGKCSPRKSAVLFPAQAFRELKEFCGWRNGRMRGVNITSAEGELRARQALYPFVAKEVKYDLEFMMVTAVDTKDFQIDQIRGLHIGDAWYYAPELAEVRGKKSTVQVRIDPENPHVVYACIKERWFTCFSTGSNSYDAKSDSQQLSEGLVRLETATLRREVRNLDDEELCRLIRAYSEDAGSSPASSPSAANNETVLRSDGEDTGAVSFDLASLLDLTADDLETESWRESYD